MFIVSVMYRASIRVTVVRNENSPVFFNDTYTVTIRQDVPSGTQIATVRAQDADTAVSTNIYFEKFEAKGTEETPQMFGAVGKV